MEREKCRFGEEVKDERGSALFDNGRVERNKNKHGFLQSRCPLPVCALPVLPGGLSFIDKHLTGGGSVL